MYKITLFLIMSTYLIASDLYYYNNHKKVYLTPQDSNQRVLQYRSVSNPHAVRFYTTTNNVVVGINDEILIKTKDIDAVLDTYEVKLKKRITSQIYLLQVKDNNLTLDISNQMYEDPDILYAHPNFIKQIHER